MAPLILAMAIVAGVEAPQTSPECGLHCLYIALRALDVPTQHAALREKLGPTLGEGYSLGRLEEVARQLGLETLAVQTTVENLRRRPGRFACIAHLDGKHFVLLTAAPANGPVHVVDPPRSYDLPPETLATRWNGTALLVSTSPLVAEEDLPRPFPLMATVGIAMGLVCAAGFVLAIRRARSSGA